jgi:Glycosyl hydrolase family 47
VPFLFYNLFSCSDYDLLTCLHLASFVTWKDSFLLSETLKYMYLVFDDSHWLRSGRWVFSTEAHPILISGKTFPWLEKLKTKGLSATGPSWRPLSSARPKRKCPRRSSIASRSSCGFGMPGTDHPTLDLGAIQNEPVEDDVRQRVRERIAFGELQLGDVFFGSKRAYRVVRFVNSEVMLANLNADEASAARRHALEVRLGAVYARVSQHVAAAHAAEFVDRSPSIPVPRLLTATREWEMLDKCESVSPMPEFGGGQLEQQLRSEKDSDKTA